ncbi:hypothetical protein [Kordiimonas sp.]|uniref:hypothetical protein n=1 Tax=Kordiimonas sp. TaxID=1970157 RepID=UPI003A92A182
MKAFLGGMVLGGFLVGAVSYYGIIAPSNEMTEKIINEKLAKALVDDRPRDERITELIIDSTILFPKLDTPYKHEEILGEGVIAALYKMTPMMSLTPDMIDRLCVYNAFRVSDIDTIFVSIGLKDPDFFQTMYDQAGTFEGGGEPLLGAFMFSGIRPLTLGRFIAEREGYPNTNRITLQLAQKDLHSTLSKLSEISPNGIIPLCNSSGVSDPEALRNWRHYIEQPSETTEPDTMDD